MLALLAAPVSPSPIVVFFRTVPGNVNTNGQSKKTFTRKAIEAPRKQKQPQEQPPDHLLLDRSLNIGPLKSRWELDKFKNC